MGKTKKHMHKVISIILVFAMVYIQVFSDWGMTNINAEGYKQTYSGVQKYPLDLQDGTYLFENVTINGTASHPSAVKISGAVTIVLKGKNNINGYDARWVGDTQYASGAGIQVEKESGYSNSVILQGEKGVSLTIKGGNANNGQDGTNGQDAYGARHGGNGGTGGVGGHGASAAIGGTGGLGGRDSSKYKGKDAGDVKILGGFELNTIGGAGGAGGKGGDGGASDGEYKFIYISIASGGGGGGGGGGGFPAPGIGGGGGAGDIGGNGSSGEGTRTTSFSAFNESGGGGGGGGRGWGAGGGGGCGFFAYYIGQPKYYHSIRPKGGKGGLSPWQYGEGGCVGIMECSQGGSGSGKSGGAYILRVGAYSGDAISVDDKFSGAGYIETARSIPGDLEARRNGRQFGGLGARTCREQSDWGGYGLDCAWAFYLQGGGETPEATNGGGAGRRYELWIRAADDGGRGETSKGGKGGKIEKSENVIFDPEDSGTGNGGSPDIDPGTISPPIQTIIDLAHPDTKVTFTPTEGTYNGSGMNPSIEIISSTGIKVPQEAYTTTTKGDLRGPGIIEYTFEGKNEDYPQLLVINSTMREYVVKKGIRTSYIVEKDDLYTRTMGDTFNVSIKNYEDDGNTVKWIIEKDIDSPDIKYNVIDKGKDGVVIESTTGTGKIHVKAVISEGKNYLEQETEPITLIVAPAGAEFFTITTIKDQRYTGSEIEPDFTVYYGNKTLVEGEDYEFHYENNVDLGRAKVIVVGIGNYEGEVNGYFNIIPADITPIRFENADYTKNPPTLKDLHYTGFPQTSPPINGYIDGKKLEEGKDYLVTYSNLTEVGKVTVTIVGIGNYAGTTELKYDILPVGIDKVAGLSIISPEDVVYDKTEKKSKPRVIFNGRELEEGKDYTLTYKDNVKAGKAIVIITGAGNFTSNSTMEEHFTIKQRPIYVVPDNGQQKTAGDKNPNNYSFTINNTIAGDKISFMENSRIERVDGEEVGNYPFKLGSLALNYGKDDNDNYTLHMSPDMVNYEIKAYETNAEAIIRGEIINKETSERAQVNADTGWYNHRVEVVAPEGYLISRSFMIDPEGTTSENSYWQPYFTSEDGDFSKEGQTYYLMKIPTTEGEVAHISKAKQVTYKQDTVKPVSRIEMNSKKIYTENTLGIKFNTYFQDEVNLDVFASDLTSGVASNGYYISEKEMSVKELDNLAESKWSKGTELSEYSLALTKEMKAVFYLRVIDVAGNVTYINTDGFYIDKTKPDISLDYPDENVWTAKKDAAVKVEVTEELSGIDERYMDYHYEFTKDGKVSDSFLIKLDKDGKAVVSGLSDGEYDFVVTAQDKAGNVHIAKKHIMIDTIDPLLEVKGNLTDYAPSKDIDILANVGTSQVAKVFVQKQDYGDPHDENGSWVDITNDYNNNKKYTVDENGTYYFKYVNGAKVESNIASISFDTIDKTVPVVEINAITVSDNQKYASGTWTKDDVKVFFKNTEDNLGQSKYSYRLKKDGVIEWGDWQSTTRANDFEAYILLSQSGIVDIEMKVTSAAGLESAVSRFVVKIDKQLPTGTITLEDKSWNNLIQAPSFHQYYNSTKQYVIKANDALSGIQSIEYILLTGDDAKKLYTLDEVKDMNGWKFDNFDQLNKSTSVTINPDNEYIIYAKIIDEVGNIRYISSDGVIIDATKPKLIVNTDALKNYSYPINTDGKWTTDPFATLPATLTDTLAGNDKLVVSYPNDPDKDVKTYDISSGSYDIGQLEDGIYDMQISGFDKAGNKDEETITIRKDSVNPDVNLIGDNVNLGTKKHVGIDPIVGCSELKSLGYQFVKDGDLYNPAGTWTDITTDYNKGYDVTEKGTLHVRIENNLGIVNFVELPFENIQEAPVEIVVDTVDEDKQLIHVSEEGWYPQIFVRFYNNPRNVSDFHYEYSTDNGQIFTSVTPDSDGYACIQAPEGTTTYLLKIINPETNKSATKDITVRVDTTKPTGVLTTKVENSRQWTNASTERSIDYGLNTGTDLILKDVQDAVDSSGLHEVQYYIMTNGKNQQLKDFPKNENAVKTELVNKWIPVTTSQLEKLKNNEEIVLGNLDIDQEYIAYVRIKDLAGNVQYITSDGITIDATKPEITTDYKTDTWITGEDDVHVTIKDNLSGVTGGTYSITIKNTTTGYNYICSQRDGQFTIPASQLQNGTNAVEISAADVAKNICDPYTVTILKDTVKPVIKIDEGNNTTHRVGIKVESIGESGIKEVYATCDNGLFEKIDITKNIAEGIQAQRNGTYTFVLVNNAGVASEPVSITYDDLGEPPILHVNGIDGKGNEYHQGTWSNSEIKMQVTVEDVMIGKGIYQYSVNGNQWESLVADKNNEYWITQSDDGEYEYRFRVIAPDGAISDTVEYLVKVDTSIPAFTYVITPKDNTNKWVDITIIPENPSETLEYSFDGGDTYQEEPEKRFISNGYVELTVRNATGTTSEQIAEIKNIDRLSPTMLVYKNRISDKGMYTIEMDVKDSPENLDFIETGINQVFITSQNPYSETNVRTQPLASDYRLELQDNQHYETNGEFKADLNANTDDNYWIIATDNVGNYKIKSFRVNPETGKPEENPDSDKPKPDDNKDVNDIIEDVENISKEINSNKGNDVELLIKRENLINTVIDNKLNDLPDNNKLKQEILDIMEQLNLSNEQRSLVETQQALLKEKNQKYIYIWIPIVILMIASYSYYRYKRKELEDNYEKESEVK